ncbi:MAG: ASKHA domain-containing protein [Anaerolineales bacterium]|jgi:uncharacterized 2Fe-2S/4Fe-4S cluster protein (DUF4445 family)
MTKRFTIDFQPIGKRIEVDSGTDLLAAAQQAGLQLVSICGGMGSCEGCRIQIISGKATEPTQFEHAALSEENLKRGLRQACQTKPLSDLTVDIPPESLATSQRLQLEGQALQVEPDPAVVPIDLRLDPPSLDDLRSDADRLTDALTAGGHQAPTLCLPILEGLSETLRGQDWSVRVALRDRDAVALFPEGSRLLGLAVDVGTTKMALYLLDLQSGETLAMLGAMNPQVAYGEDVVSRIAYTEQHEGGRQLLQSKVIEALNAGIQQCCDQAGVSQTHIVDAVVVGNTAMHHLFAGLPVRQLGLAPYVAAVSDPLQVPANPLGLELAPCAQVYLPPVIAGYVGADHVSMLLASEVWNTKKTVVALDIGTNTEITLAVGGRLLCCSCASGPAFEGGHIHDGMRAAPGAIERVQIHQGQIRLQTIDNQPPVGICGSGILDAVAELLEAKALNPSGNMDQAHGLVRRPGRHPEVVLAETDRSAGHNRDVVVTRKDVHEIQLAKAAIRTGLEILLAEAGVSHDEIEEFIVTGAFGTYLNLRSAIRIGMFPDLPLERFRQIGNAAGAGATQMLISKQRRQLAEEITQRVEYVELTTHPGFSDRYMKALYL